MRFSFVWLFILTVLSLIQTPGFAQHQVVAWSLPPNFKNEENRQERIKLPYQLHAIRFNINSDTIGLLGQRKHKAATLLTYPTRNQNLFEFVKSNYQFRENGSSIELRIEQFQIHPFKAGIASPEDTFYYACTFLKKSNEGQEEDLFQFKAKNLMGAIDLAEESFKHYVARVVNQSIQQFTKSFDLNPHWDTTKDTSSYGVKTEYLFNHQLGKDSIACHTITMLDSSYFNINTKKDSTQVVGHCRLILTYSIFAEEHNANLKLILHTKAFLSKSRSWIHPSLVNTTWYDYQKGHVRICAIYGRKLDEEFKKTRFTFGEYKYQANQAYNKVYDEYVRLRKQYADETNNGNIASQLKKWDEKITIMEKTLK